MGSFLEVSQRPITRPYEYQGTILGTQLRFVLSPTLLLMEILKAKCVVPCHRGCRALLPP